MSTCFFCDTKIENIPDRVVRMCKCGALGVDCSPEYTRYLGSKPVEDMTTDDLQKYETLKNNPPISLKLFNSISNK